MTTTDLWLELTRRGYSQRKARKVLQVMFNGMKAALARGEEVQIDDLVILRKVPSRRKPKVFRMRNGTTKKGVLGPTLCQYKPWTIRSFPLRIFPI